MLWAQRSRAQAWLAGDVRLHGAGGLRQRAGAVTYIRTAVVTCLELCCSPPPGLPVSGPAPSGYSLARPRCLATQCERGGGALTLAGTPNDAPMPCQGLEMSFSGLILGYGKNALSRLL